MEDFFKEEDGKKKEIKIKKGVYSLKKRYNLLKDLFKESEEKWEITHQPTKQWLHRLKLYSAEVEDLYEEYDYEIVRLSIKQQSYTKEYKNKLRRKDISPSTSYQSSLNREMNDEMSLGAHNLGTTSDSFSISFIEYMLSCLEELQVKYDDICKQREEDLIKRAEKDVLYVNLGKDDSKESEVTLWRTASVPFTNEPNIYGRDDDEKDLLEKLLESDEQVIALVGMGGLGKTTLAQKLYKNRVIRSHFATQVWVCVSDDFDVKRITQDALDSVTKEKCSFNVFSVIQEKLSKELKGKKFMLVLDDVWIENQCDWECLGFLSNLGSDGSKILVTTRSRVVAEAIYPTLDCLMYDLKTLHDTDSLELFQSLAFCGLDDQKKQELKNMSMEIVKKCNGLPLMISVIGKLLHDTNGDKEKWRTIIESDAWKTEFILNTYKISYDHLSYKLKQCFLYCSVFPKDHLFGQGELSKLWIAQGLIKDGASKPIWEVEIECVDGLLHRSFLEQHEDRLGEVRYSMHDIMHALARYVLHEEQSMASEGLSLSSDSHSGHNSEEICADISNCIEPIVGRTLHHSMYPKPKGVKSVPLHVDLKRLRVMICNASYFDTMSDLVGEFKHLRYLKLKGRITNLPEVICQLYNLQSLHFIKDPLNFELPKDIGNLKKLQHVHMYYGCMKLTCGIGELVHLRTLAAEIEVTRYGEYCTISELENLSCLGGEIIISGLENVKTIEEARSARFEMKKNIESLEFCWDISGDLIDEKLKQRYTNILDNLLPNESLGELSIYGYYGSRFPYWLANGSLINLTVLTLALSPVETLPMLGKIPSLKDLTINFFGNLKRVGDEIYDRENPGASFKSLERLEWSWMDGWEDWCLVDKCHFHSLHELTIRDCRKLRVYSNASRMFCKLGILNVTLSPHLTEWCRKHAETSLSQVQDLILDGDIYYFPRRGSETFRADLDYELDVIEEEIDANNNIEDDVDIYRWRGIDIFENLEYIDDEKMVNQFQSLPSLVFDENEE